MKNLVLSLMFLFVVSLGVQAQSTPQKKDTPATTTTDKSKKEKVKMEKKSSKKACSDAKEKGCCGDAAAGCAEAK